MLINVLNVQLKYPSMHIFFSSIKLREIGASTVKSTPVYISPVSPNMHRKWRKFLLPVSGSLTQMSKKKSKTLLMHDSIPLAESGFSPCLNHNGMSSQQTDHTRSVGKCNKRGLCASPPPPVTETAKIDIGMKGELFFPSHRNTK